MGVVAVRQLDATINSGSTTTWSLFNGPPAINPNLNPTAKPDWLLMAWQAVPIVTHIDPDSPGIRDAVPSLLIAPVTIVQQDDTGIQHNVSITCKDVGNPPPSHAKFIVTYSLYALYIDDIQF